MTRVRIAPDCMSRVLKRIDTLDEILAVSSVDNPLRFVDGAVDRFPHKNFYPSSGGLLGFCTRAEECLKNMGVNLAFCAKVQAINADRHGVTVRVEDGSDYQGRRLLWCLDVGPLASLLECATPTTGLYVPVPMVLYYFLVPKDTKVEYTYLHDFSPDSRIYRVSSPGIYGEQRNAEGLSYICCECPTDLGSEMWQEPEAFSDEIWAEVQQTGMLNLECQYGMHVVKTPVSYKGFSTEYGGSLGRIHDCIDQFSAGIQLVGAFAFSKADIVAELEEHLNAD